MTEENLAARSRRLTEEALEPLEKKVRAGEWLPLDAVRTVMARLINRYEGLLEIAKGESNEQFERNVRLHEIIHSLTNGEEE